MRIIDKINNADSVDIDLEFVEKVEKVYSCKLPEKVKHILSIDSNEDYDDRNDLYKLSNDMILEASEEMNSDFQSKHLLPIFNLFDNDYVCYDYSNDSWCMFNIVDYLDFNCHQNLPDLFE